MSFSDGGGEAGSGNGGGEAVSGSGGGEAGSGNSGGEAGSGNGEGGPQQQQPTQQQGGSGGHSVLLMGAASDGRVWQWQAPLLEGTLPGARPAALPSLPKPELLGAEGNERHADVKSAALPPASSATCSLHQRPQVFTLRTPLL